MLRRVYDAIESSDKRLQSQLAFMPAALEIQETPPSPIGRAIIWSIILLLVLAVAWAWWGEIDVVAVAPGKIIPSDRVKTIQPLELGVVQEIHVDSGQHVARGDALITLDATQSAADERRMAAELQVAKLDAERQIRFEGYLKTGHLDAGSAEAAVDASPAQKAVQERLLQEQINEYESQLETINSQLAQRQAELAATTAEITKLEKTLPIITQRAESLETLLERKMVSENAFLELEQQRIEAEQDLVAQQSKIAESRAAISALQNQQNTLTAEALKRTLADQQEHQRRIAVLEQEFIKAERRHSQQVLYAPIDGVVHDLSVFTVGGVVTPAEKLMSIVPANSELEVEAFVLNRDIGFVEEGQVAEVKIATFNFTKYGVVDAEIIDLSNDAMSDERLGLVYQAKVALKDTQLLINDKWVNLSPGMSVTVEIKTGTRRIIEFFLSPLLRYRDESIRER